MLERENGSAVKTVQAAAQDTNGYPLQVVWPADGTADQTNNIPPRGAITASNVTLTASFRLEEHVVAGSASIGRTDPVTCSTTEDGRPSPAKEERGIELLTGGCHAPGRRFGGLMRFVFPPDAD
jgi:hypothetical protein